MIKYDRKGAFYVQKISISVINKIIDRNLTSDEINFFLYIAQYQNALGQVRGIYYRHAIMELNISKPQFYHIIRSLEAKGIITVDWSNDCRCWNFVINDNIFLTREDNKKGYININRPLLHSSGFKGSKANIKKLILKLLIVSRDNEHFKINLDKLCSWVGIKSTHLMGKYLDALKQWFDIRIAQNGTYIIKLISDSRRTQSEITIYYQHFIKSFCSKYRIAFTPDSLKDLVILLGQYKSKLNKLISVICSTCLQHHSIEPKLINSIMASGN